MKVKKQPGFIRNFLTTTENDRKIPNNEDLDSKIETLKALLSRAYPLFIHITIKKVINTFKYKWDRLLKKTLIWAMFFGLCFTSYQLYFVPTPQEKAEKEQRIIEKKIFLEHPTIPKGNLEFISALSQLESGGRYDIIGGSNNKYWGAYQMGAAARKDIGLSGMSMEKFLTNPVVQDWAMNEYMKVNYSRLKKTIEEYNIPERGGIRIGHNLVTVSGLMAAAHLVGSEPVKHFVKTKGKDLIDQKTGRNKSKDGNGVHLTHYLQLNNYELKFE